MAYVAGLFHDLGKYDPAFQRRLEGVDVRVDHSTVGAVELRSRIKGDDADMAELVMYGSMDRNSRCWIGAL